MPQGDIMRAEQPGVRRHAEHQAAADSEHAADFARGERIVRDVLEHIRCEHEVERPLGERKCRPHRAAEERPTPLPGQPQRAGVRLDSHHWANSGLHRDVSSRAAPEIQDPRLPTAPLADKQLAQHEPPPPEPPVAQLLMVHDPVFVSAHGYPRTRPPGLPPPMRSS